MDLTKQNLTGHSDYWALRSVDNDEKCFYNIGCVDFESYVYYNFCGLYIGIAPACIIN